ncbi:MAG TPA: Stp1/IreP family PP2C-type Ser/Thr phosphatase [Candidatus Atribacteria bacterium]|nr:Stp1/IreP family PP2C-type Ser/Thr phosphatase [Candidatus Atribacteria bacterium]
MRYDTRGHRRNFTKHIQLLNHLKGGKNLKVFFSAKSDLGLKRKLNEDSYFADDTLGLFIVLDGIGGHFAGEVASKLGLGVIKESVIRGIKDKKRKTTFAGDSNLSPEAHILKESLIVANQLIYEAAHTKPEYFGMGTTVASLLFGEKIVAFAHVGDSRIYLIRKDSIERLTEDHSLVMEQLKRGIINEEEAEKSETKNIITRALGAEEILIPAVDDLIFFKNDLLLICSDGLTDLVNDEEILEIILKNRLFLDQTTQGLIDKANENGGKDNITTILVYIKSVPRKRMVDCFYSAFDWAFSRFR